MPCIAAQLLEEGEASAPTAGSRIRGDVQSKVMPRCWVCGARERGRAAPHWQRCGWCGLTWQRDAVADGGRLHDTIESGPVSMVKIAAAGAILDDVTLRQAALAQDLWLPAGPNGPASHTHRPASGVLTPLADLQSDAVTLVVLSRADETNFAALLGSTCASFAEVIVVRDAPASEPVRADGVTLLDRPLDGHFGAQRSAAQALVATPWAFHLDTDETLPTETLRRLGRVARAARESGFEAVGLPRRNWVDGALSDHWPDTQYRLVRQSVRFPEAVHERPDACATWWRTTVDLGGRIDHHLTGGRVKERHAQYQRLGQHGDRADDANALLRPFRDDYAAAPIRRP
ncbi:MAG: hypothetical protein AAFZ05_04960 [Pseudomonadota bacterium]